MINKETLIKLINEEAYVYLVGLEVFATKAQAKRCASVLNYYADSLGKPRVSVEKIKAHTLSNTI